MGDIERSVFALLTHHQKVWQKRNNSGNYVDFHEANSNFSMQSEFHGNDGSTEKKKPTKMIISQNDLHIKHVHNFTTICSLEQ